jgi:tetratricopeptide (TPR) repeat protein
MPDSLQPTTDVAVNRRRLALIVTTCIALTVFMFAPPISQIQSYLAGHYYYPRLDDFLAQCKDPLRRDLQSTTVAWRLLVPLVCHLLRLPGRTPLVVPWLGGVVVVAYAAVLFRRRLDDWRYVAGGTLLFATTATVLVTIRSPGINDSWVWLGLLTVAFGRGFWSVPVACLLCPWVDERFLIGFPLAWLVGRFERGVTWDWPSTSEGLWLLPYAAIRFWLGRHDYVADQASHLALALYIPQAISLMPMIPIGWWMGLRAGWLAIAYACWTTPPGRRVLGAATLIVTVVNTIGLSYDLSRSIAILVPVALLGCFEYARRAPTSAPRILLALGITNLFLPAAVVMDQNIETICPLPLEILRLYIGPLVKERTLETTKYFSKISPTPDNLLSLSLQYYQCGQFEDSLQAAQDALRLRPGFTEAYNNVAADCLSLGRWDEAIAAAREALRIHPDFPLARNNLRSAEIQGQRSAWEAAKMYLTKIFKDPSTVSFGNEISSGDNTSDSQNWLKNSVPQLDGTYKVTIWVDALNGQGAKIRGHYQLSLHYRGVLQWEIVGNPILLDR